MDDGLKAKSEGRTTGLVEVHENIGREGCIVELRRDDRNAPSERDMSHLSDEKARLLRDLLDDYLDN